MALPAGERLGETPGIPSATVRRFYLRHTDGNGQRHPERWLGSGRDVRLYSSLDETRLREKLARHPSFTVVSEQIKARAGETLLETAISLQKTGSPRRHSRLFIWRFPVVESKTSAWHGGPG